MNKSSPQPQSPDNQSKADNFKEIYRVPGAEIGLEAYQPAIYAYGDQMRISVGGHYIQERIEYIHSYMWNAMDTAALPPPEKPQEGTSSDARSSWLKEIEEITKEMTRWGDHWDCDDSCTEKSYLTDALAAIQAATLRLIGGDQELDWTMTEGPNPRNNEIEAMNQLRASLRDKIEGTNE